MDIGSPAPAPHPSHSHGRRALGLLVLCAVAAVAFSFDAIHAPLVRLLTAAGPVIATHPGWGAIAFVVLSAASAMLAFFSSAILVPAAVVTWGRWPTIALLWLGWLLGGVCAYAIGRLLGRPLVSTVASTRLMAFYQRRVGADIGFPMVLLLQFALPSEIPGYLCGLLRVRKRVYFAALALAEIPYAVGTVLLGESVLRRHGDWLLGLGLAGVCIGLLAAWLLHRRLGGGRPPG